MRDFYFSDKSWANDDHREVRIEVNTVAIILLRDNEYWNCYFYDLRKPDGEQYIMDINISNALALRIIEEAKEYQAFYYARNSYK